MKFFLVGVVVVLNVSSHILFKIASKETSNAGLLSIFLDWRLIVGGFLQIVALISWVKLLNFVDLSWAALMVTLIPLTLILSGVFIFGETLSTSKIIGAVIILTGLYIINI